MRTLAIVPVKSFGEAKQRLAESLARGARRSLAQAMFSDVLAAIDRARGVDAVAVVTADAAAVQLAHGRATVLHDAARAGQSAAAAIGIRHALDSGFPRALLVPGDTPLVDSREIDLLLERSARDRIGVAIVSDRHGTGTNALVLTPPDAIEPAFGPDSLHRHLGLARAAGVTCRVEPAPSLEHDVDTPEDLTALREAVAAVRGRAQRTRGILHQIEHARRAAARPAGVGA